MKKEIKQDKTGAVDIGYLSARRCGGNIYGRIKRRCMSGSNGVLGVLLLILSLPIVAQGYIPVFEQVADNKILLTQITGSPYVLSAVANKGKIESAYDLRIEHFYSKASTAGSSYDYDIRKVGDFSSCEYITSLTIPEYTFVSAYPDDLHLKSIREIAVGAFSNCCSLTVARILAPGIVALPQSCFWGCEKLSEIEMPNITDVGDEAFAGCAGLKKVAFGRGLKSLGKDSFRGAVNLESVSFSSFPPSGLNDSHLLDHISLSQISIPDGYMTEWVAALSQCGKNLVVEFRPAGCIGVEAGVPQQLEMVCEYADARIYYTIDGSVPTDKSMEYTGPISVVREKGKDLVVKAIAVSGKWPVDSPIVQTISYTLENCSAPQIQSNAGAFERPLLGITITSATKDATIYYTLDGSEPSEGIGLKYTQPFDIYKTTIVKAIAIKEDFKDSAVSEVVFEKENKLSEASGLLNYLPRDWHYVDGSSEPWEVVSEDTHGGSVALKSDSYYSKMDVTVPGTGRIAFWWKIVGEQQVVGSLSLQGMADFYVDGQLKASLWDSGDWQQVVVDIREPGEHTLVWEYWRWNEEFVSDDSGARHLLLDDMSWSAVIDDELTSCVAEYDGKGHSIAVAAAKDAQATVLYSQSENGPYTDVAPETVDVSDPLTVWYKVDGGMVDGVPVYLGEPAVGKATVTIQPKLITPEMITILENPVYDGTAREPRFAVADGEPSIIKDSDWELVGYSNNVDAGVATVTIRAVEGGNYRGEATASFEIAKAVHDVSGMEWTKDRTFVYDGKMHGVSIVGLPEGVTASLAGNEARDAGSYRAHAELTVDEKNYQVPSIADCTWTIERRDVVLKVADLDKSFDGYALSASSKDVSAEGYVEGECLDYYDFTQLVAMGCGISSFSYRDSETAKASNYNVTLVEGTLRVTVGSSVYAGEVVSAKMRASDPNVMDVQYVVRSVKDKVDVRLAVFKDGVRSFANVILPEAFVDGTEANVGDGVMANSTNTVSWRVSDDWNIDLAKVKVDVLVKPNETYLPFKWVTIPGRKGRPTVKVSTNPVEAGNLFNALLWLYADRDAGLSLVEGGLLHEGLSLVVGDDVTDAGVRYVYEKMGYSALEGEMLDYVRSALRKPMKNEPAFSLYAVQVLGE